MQSPRVYTTFLLWLLSELFERFPEAGDLQKPKLVFFFDEAHLLFADTPKVLEEKIVQVVRLIRSKGIGIYFVTQNPLDLPDPVLGQLGNRVHHALRAFTPKDAKNVKGAADTLRPNPAFDTATAMTELQIGEVLISVLDDRGSPAVTERAFMYPPRSRFAPLTPDERMEVIRASPLRTTYTELIDRESAYELLKKRAESIPPMAESPGRKTPGVHKRHRPGHPVVRRYTRIRCKECSPLSRDTAGACGSPGCPRFALRETIIRAPFFIFLRSVENPIKPLDQIAIGPRTLAPWSRTGYRIFCEEKRSKMGGQGACPLGLPPLWERGGHPTVP